MLCVAHGSVVRTQRGRARRRSSPSRQVATLISTLAIPYSAIASLRGCCFLCLCSFRLVPITPRPLKFLRPPNSLHPTGAADARDIDSKGGKGPQLPPALSPFTPRLHSPQVSKAGGLESSVELLDPTWFDDDYVLPQSRAKSPMPTSNSPFALQAVDSGSNVSRVSKDVRGFVACPESENDFFPVTPLKPENLKGGAIVSSSAGSGSDQVPLQDSKKAQWTPSLLRGLDETDFQDDFDSSEIISFSSSVVSPAENNTAGEGESVGEEVGRAGPSRKVAVVDDKENFIVLHPDTLVSGTNLSAACECLRRAVTHRLLTYTQLLTEIVLYTYRCSWSATPFIPARLPCCKAPSRTRFSRKRCAERSLEMTCWRR